MCVTENLNADVAKNFRQCFCVPIHFSPSFAGGPAGAADGEKQHLPNLRGFITPAPDA
jgi:hypothetical protein